MRNVRTKIVATLLGFCLFAGSAAAAIVNFQFDAILQSGALAGTNFSGAGSYNTQGSTGMGQEFLTLTSLNFTLLGVPFTRADIDQGGQAILQDGSLAYFTAAFFPPPPPNSPVNDIAFGFGGPGIIGYSTPPGFNFGAGVYTLSPSTIPEPAALRLIITGLTLMGFGVLRLRSCR
jgi:hypothetical protein